MTFNPAKLIYAFGAPPPGAKLYKKSMLYVTDDAIADVCSPGYLAGSDLNDRDVVTVTSTHPTEGGENISRMVKVGEGGVLQLINSTPLGFSEP